MIEMLVVDFHLAGSWRLHLLLIALGVDCRWLERIVIMSISVRMVLWVGFVVKEFTNAEGATAAQLHSFWGVNRCDCFVVFAQ